MDKCCTCSKCSIVLDEALALLSGKWTLPILWKLYEGTKRFNQLQRLLPGISPKTLSVRLQELEQSGIITKTIYAEIPLRVEYDMTEKGRGLKPVFTALISWANIK